MSSPAPRKLARSLLITGIAVVAMACAAPGAGSSGAPSLAATSGSSAAPSSPSASGPTATFGGGKSAQVDLTFTGTYAFTAKGTAGRCIVIQRTDGVAFGFEATEADYPGLGQSFSMGEFNGLVDIKWIKDDATSWGNNPNASITLTADHHGVSMDQDLAPFTPMGGSPAGPEHVSGTVICA